MRYALCIALLLTAFAPGNVAADPFRINIQARQRDYERLHAEALKRIDPDALLDALWTHASFKDQHLQDVLDALSANVGNRFVIDAKALAEADLDFSRVTLDREDTTVRAVLSQALKLSGADKQGIRFEVIDDLVVVSNAKHIAFLKRWFAAAASDPTTRPARNPFAARIGAVSRDVCTERVQFGLCIANVTVAEAVNEVAEEAAVRVEVDWDSLKRCGINGDADVNDLRDLIEIPNVSIASALAVFFSHYDGFWSCSLQARDGRIVIRADKK